MSRTPIPDGLMRVGARLPLGPYLREVWERRDFIAAMASSRIQAENERNRLGMGWVVLRPLLNALIYGLIFGLILGGSRPDNFVPYVIAGVFLFEFFNNSVLVGGRSITSNFYLVQSLSFPRLALPVAVVYQQLLVFLPTLVLMAFLVLPFGGHLTWRALLLVPLTALFTVFNVGVALVVARLTVHFRDLSQLMPFITRILFYTAGVFFDPMNVLAGNRVATTIYHLYPLNQVLALGRSFLLPGYEAPLYYWWVLAIWAVVMLVVGVVYFWSAEERYGRDE